MRTEVTVGIYRIYLFFIRNVHKECEEAFVVEIESSRQRELPPPPLTEPYVKLSLHTALMIQAKV